MMWSDIVMMWRHHPVMLVILAVLCIILARLLVKRLFQWVAILILVIAVYSIFMFATGKRTKEQLWKEGKTGAERFYHAGKSAVKGDSSQSEESSAKKRHSPRTE
jgi:hypothetical protein